MERENMTSLWAKIILGDSRRMEEIPDQSVDLVVTSPPYWHIKDYGVPGQIGYGQSLHDYLRALFQVWQECHRVLRPGCRLCINIGDQFARASIYGRYRVIPLHAECITQCERLGFDFLGSIIWQKKTTMNPSGGANVMGSFPYPPNGLVEIDYEFILLFKKPGKGKTVAKNIKDASRLTKEEWKTFFSGHWTFGGARQIHHEAVFPEELPRRLIRMFTFREDTVLDPFLGSGTTVKVALSLGRCAIGYEINPSFLEIILEKLGLEDSLPGFHDHIQILYQEKPSTNKIDQGSDKSGDIYIPGIQDAFPVRKTKRSRLDELYSGKVIQIRDNASLRLETGEQVQFLGVTIQKRQETLSYLRQYLLGKTVYLDIPQDSLPKGNFVEAYVYLKNRIFINTFLIRAGLARPDSRRKHRLAEKFRKLWEEAQKSCQRNGS